jgi:hypothetical protein
MKKNYPASPSGFFNPRIFAGFLLCSAGVMALVTYQASATITVTGTSGSTTPGGIFDTPMVLNITGTPPADVQSINLLLETPDSGLNNGAPYFTVYVLSLTAPFDGTNSPSDVDNQSSFNVPGLGPNSGFLLSDTSLDLGANKSGSAITNPGTLTLPFDTLRFTADPSTPAGTYNFYATLGPFAPQGTAVFDSNGTEFDLTSNPLFTITITEVPEPSTWFAGIAALGVIGFTILRRRATA